VNFTEISEIDVNNITQELFNDSIEFLSNNIDQYLIENQGTNLINIAKSKDFTEYLFRNLENKYCS
jgi:hypothetical protein